MDTISSMNSNQTGSAYATMQSEYYTKQRISNNSSRTEASMQSGSNSQISQTTSKQTSASEVDAFEKKVTVSGQTIGSPQLSEKAAKYYEQLKKKFGNLDFILVSEDQKANAQQNIGKYVNTKHMVVLIDTDKIEKMATDEKYREKYEKIIRDSTNQLSQMESSLSIKNAGVKTYGVQFDDGGNASYFAVVDKFYEEQDKRIAKRAETRKSEAKAAEKKAAKTAKEKKALQKKEQQKISEKKASQKAPQQESQEVSQQAGSQYVSKNHVNETWFDNNQSDQGDTITLTASSIDELMLKLDRYTYAQMSNNMQTEQEKNVGQHIDFKG